VSGALVSYRTWLGLVGGMFLCYLGVRTLVATPKETTTSSRRQRIASAYASTFMLTLTNPMTILSFVAIFAGLGVASGVDFDRATMLVIGVFAGSAAWWLLLSTGTAMLRSKLSDTSMRLVNHVSGSIIVAFGIYAIATAFRS